jgi:hypothetical protein
VTTLDPSPLRRLERVLMLAANLTPAQAALREALAAVARDFNCREVGGPLPWTRDNDFGAGPLPVAAMKTIVEWRGMG